MTSPSLTIWPSCTPSHSRRPVPLDDTDARRAATTRPVAAGFAAGVMAGSVGAFGYALSCPEASPAFVATWYTLGIALTGALGAALGPRVLRW